MPRIWSRVLPTAAEAFIVANTPLRTTRNTSERTIGSLDGAAARRASVLVHEGSGTDAAAGAATAGCAEADVPAVATPASTAGSGGRALLPNDFIASTI
ncbi:hypothetical protein BGC_33170 [Burkholderia sp. 3C]